MAFKSDKQPLCRYCGKPIRKYTTMVYCSGSSFKSEYSRNVDAVLRNKADCQRHTNGHVMSVRYTGYEPEPGSPATAGCVTRVYSFTEWDGESYVDQFFCNGDHARRMGYAAARNGQAMESYNNAIRARAS